MAEFSSILRSAAATEAYYEPVAVMLRDHLVESVHRGAIAVVDSRGRLAGGVGDPDVGLLVRSAAKPFQALAVVESGAAAALSLSQAELAIMCGSHAGRIEHVEVVERLLGRLGVSIDTLVCGPLSHMCSGKHAGMIALALHLGVPIDGYEKVSHPVQQEIETTMIRLLDRMGAAGASLSAGGAAAAVTPAVTPTRAAASPPGAAPTLAPTAGSAPMSAATPARESIFAGTDSCGVPNVKLSLREVAYLYALLAAGATDGLVQIRDAMMAFPQLVAGEGRLDTGLMKAASGRLVAKAGAEGIMALGFASAAAADTGPAASFGCVIKIADGSARAIPAALKPCLEAYDVAVADEVLVHARPRSPEVVRGIQQESIVPVIEPGKLRRTPLPNGPEDDGHADRPDLVTEDEEVRVTIGRGDEKDVLRFLREEWPPSDEETFGRPLEWIAEPHALIVRRHRKMIGVLRGHFTGGVASVDELMVGREQRGTGLGSMLLARFEAEAEARECSRIVLRAVKDSAAESFYHDRGYRRACIEWSYEFGYDYVRLTRELGSTDAGQS